MLNYLSKHRSRMCSDHFLHFHQICSGLSSSSTVLHSYQQSQHKSTARSKKWGQLCTHLLNAFVNYGWRFGLVVSTLVLINEVNLRQARLVLRWVTVSRVQLPVQENLSQYITSHPGQISLVIPQRAVMLCGWGVKAGMICEWVAGKTVWSNCYHGPYLSVSSNGFIP